MNYFLSDSSGILPSNSIIDMRYDGAALWIGASGGVARTTDGGATWVKFSTADGLKSNSVSGLAVTPDVIWAATSRSEVREGELIPIGTGLNKSTDMGTNWETFEPQQASFFGQLAYDLVVTDSTLWAACFYGGLIRSHPADTTFFNVFPDSASRHDFENELYTLLRNRFFSVTADTTNADSTIIYGGSAAGVARFAFYTSDSIPDTVVQVSHSDNLPDDWRLPGDFVITLETQYTPDPVIWASCKPVSSGQSIAISRSTDHGRTWNTPFGSEGFECWNFAFDDTIVYAATTQGLVRSYDNGESWEQFSGFVDYDNGNVYLSTTFYAVELVGDTIWAGGPDGVVRSTDDGLSWKVYRSYLPAGSADAGDSYAYPVPFSPERGRGSVRIHYKAPSTTTATIKIYDFGMNLVKIIAEDKPVVAGVEYDNDLWYGANIRGDLAANGIYFYRIEMADGTDWWGKLAVLK
ncbi:MAG: hypothetical protein GF307_11710 [candidate division Zixibacteria bacterium]|nr:hypothetical protein [candidate division Zixibacteria bacterium]